MINYSNWDDGSLTAAYGANLRQRQDQSQFYNNMRADILAECLKLIDQRINIQITNEASPALKQFKNDLQALCK